MIISRLHSGLGNQLFQYAAGLALAERRRTILKLDVAWFSDRPGFEAHNRYALGCFNLGEHFATEAEVVRLRGRTLSRTERWAQRLARRLHFFQYADSLEPHGHIHYQPDGWSPYHEDFLQQPDSTYLDGYWQSERFFAPVAELLRQQLSFRYPLAGAAAAVRSQILDTQACAVHFRRGDYVSNPDFKRRHGVLPAEYYRQAEARLRERVPDATLFVFSDDVRAVAAEFTPRGPHVFVPTAPALRAHDDLHLMSLCRHAIIANSTFGWWGAWLIRAPEKLVFAPKQWFADAAFDTRDVCPPEWLRL